MEDAGKAHCDPEQSNTVVNVHSKVNSQSEVEVNSLSQLASGMESQGSVLDDIAESIISTLASWSSWLCRGTMDTHTSPEGGVRHTLSIMIQIMINCTALLYDMSAHMIEYAALALQICIAGVLVLMFLPFRL